MSYGTKLTTKSIGNAQNTKWTRYDSRGILTPREKKILKNGSWHYDRTAKLKIKLKTRKAMNDLALILPNMKPSDFLSIGAPHLDIKVTRDVLKTLLIYYYGLEEREHIRQRTAKKTKRKVAFRDAWKPIMELIRETKIEIQR
jgi:hypothetical protein